MDNLTFISRRIDSLAWPLSIALIIIVLRKEILNLSKKVRRFQYKDMQIDFIEKMKFISKDAKTALPPSNSDTNQERKNLDQLAELMPKGAILDAWIKVEAALKAAGKRNQYSEKGVPPSAFFSYVISGLKSRKKISRETFDIYNRLRTLRNEAVHSEGTSIDEKTAKEYSDLCVRLINAFDKA